MVPAEFGRVEQRPEHVPEPRWHSGRFAPVDVRDERRAFVVSFDSRLVAVFDPVLRRIDVNVRTGRGPHGIAVDARIDPETGEASSFLYITHFTDSYLGVADLDMRRSSGVDTTYGGIVLSLGPPEPPRESQ